VNHPGSPFDVPHRTPRRSALVFTFFAALSVAWTWPLPTHLASRVAFDPGDPLLNAWILWWNAQAVPLTTAWWDPPIFYPMRGALALSEHLAGVGLVTTPVILAGGTPALAYNLALLASCTLSGFFTYLLVRRLTGSPLAALVAGTAYAIAPFRAGQLSHLQVLVSQWLPLMLLGLHGYIDTRRRRWLVLFGGAWIVQSLSNGYYLLFAPALVAAWLAWFVVAGRQWRDLVRIGAAWFIASIALVPVLLEYRQVHSAFGLSRPPGEILMFSGDLTSFLKPAPMLAYWPLSNRLAVEDFLFPGLTVVVLVAAALIRAAWGCRRRTSRPSSDAAAEPVLDTPAVEHLAAGTLPESGAAEPAAAETVLDTGTTEKTGAGTLLHTRSAENAAPEPVPATRGAGKAAAGTDTRSAKKAIVGTLPDTRSPTGDALRREWDNRSVRVMLFYVVAALLMGALTLGPARPGEGWAGWLRPYQWLMILPGFDGVRVPVRFAMLMALCLSVAGGFGAAAIMPAARMRRVFVTTLILGGLWLDGAIQPLTGSTPPARVELPTAPAAAVLELPADDTGVNVGAMFRSISHGLPLINGYSGYVPPHYDILGQSLRRGDPSAVVEMARGRSLLILINGRNDPAGDFRALIEGIPGVVPGEITAAGRSYLLPAQPRERRAAGGTPYSFTSSPLPRSHYLLDLGARRVVRTLEFPLRDRYPDFGRRLQVEVSDDGETWTNGWEDWTAGTAVAGALEDQTIVPIRITLPDLRGRYLRIHPAPEWLVEELTVSGP
jgi:hypothetical protein